MSDIAISAEKLSKHYLVGHQLPEERYATIRESMMRSAKNLTRKTGDMMRGRQIISGDEIEEFWALTDVSFELKAGDTLGVIGRNGAGKSTLLKVLSRITEPSRGRVLLNGRIASLLEVGTGFHPELTGRENIFLNGAILGMTKREIRSRFDEIVDFAGVETFLDTPVKRYSSGMYVRLAFAIAAHLEPEILVVDEVLAVGDIDFQKKCLGKMQNVAGDGRTVLFVSHNMGSLLSLCSKGLYLKNGKVVSFGSCPEVVARYQADGSAPSLTFSPPAQRTAARKERGEPCITGITFKKPPKHTETAEGFVEVWLPSATKLAVGVGFSNSGGTRLLTYDSDLFTDDEFSIPSQGTYRLEFRLPDLPLPPDIYSFDVGCRQGTGQSLDYIQAVGNVEVQVHQRSQGFITNRYQTVRLPSEWRLNDEK